MVRRLARRAPAVAVELRAAGWRAATDELAEPAEPGAAAVSAALMSNPFPAGLAVTARFTVPVRHLAVPAGSPMATAARLGREQLARQKVLISRHRPPGSRWARLEAWLAGRSRLVDEDLHDLPAGLNLVAAGRGVLPVPQLLAQTIRRPDVRFVPLDAPGLRIGYGLVWRRQAASSELMALVEAAQEVHRNRSGS